MVERFDKIALFCLSGNGRVQCGIQDHFSLLKRVVYPRHADKYLGPLASRLRTANQPVSRTPNQFSTPRPRPLVGI